MDSLISAHWYITEFLIDECRGSQELILAALKLFQNFFKKVCTNSKQCDIIVSKLRNEPKLIKRVFGGMKMKKIIEMAKRIGSFNSVNQVIRFLTNNNETVIAIDGMTISTLNGNIELTEKIIAFG